MEAQNKTEFSERDICSKYITPALEQAGWDLQTQIREEVTLTKGRILVRGTSVGRGKHKFADYILYHKSNIPLAIIEAKDNNHSISSGMQQALTYAEMIDVPFVYSSNGDGFLEHDRTRSEGDIERELALDAFPSPQQLWIRYGMWKGIHQSNQHLVVQDYYTDGSGKEPRYYQLVAINRTIEAIARGQQRILLVMATGTGKTFTAFQIIWRLWKSKAKRRILFLADRNILVDQTRTNDFKPFGQAMTKIQNRQIDKSYEIYLSLYQAVTGNEVSKNIYQQFSPDFFDLVIVDECHRGSAAEDSAWREILEYFASATQIGLTATPKETKEVSNIDYFGEPIYTYSLKQGIDDGFLAPYKVVRIDINRDLDGWQPKPGQRDKYGRLIEERLYNQKDFDRTLVLEKRTRLVAQKITEYLKATDRYAKTIVFCEDVDHAERMRRELVNQNADLVQENSRYVVRITGDDTYGKAQLDEFILPESRYPVIATTSRLMTTGVDAQTCKFIVLDRRIQSMTEFKQIIGRGTRINEEYGKTYFTIMDFKKATQLFADPDFDGDPVQVYEPESGETVVPPDDEPSLPNEPEGEFDTTTRGRRIKFVVADAGAEVVSERTQYYGKDGKLITESLKDYTRKTVKQTYASLDNFLRRWQESDRKQAILDELREQGINLEDLAADVGKDFDLLDLICHVAFDRPPQSRRDRARNIRQRDYFAKYGERARAVLDALLEKYADEGVESLEDMGILKVQPISDLGTPLEIVKMFGNKQNFQAAVRELIDELYSA